MQRLRVLLWVVTCPHSNISTVNTCFLQRVVYSLLAIQINASVLGRSVRLRVKVKFSVVFSYLQPTGCTGRNITNVYNTIQCLHRLSGLQVSKILTFLIATVVFL